MSIFLLAFVLHLFAIGLAFSVAVTVESRKGKEAGGLTFACLLPALAAAVSALLVHVY